MGNKLCSKCQKVKPSHDFQSRTGGKGLSSRCKQCNSVQNDIRRKKHRALLRRYKQIKGCIICGDHNATHLVFHAPNGHKEGKVSSLVGAWMKAKTEVFRCVVVCANCHMDLHAGEVRLPSRGINAER